MTDEKRTKHIKVRVTNNEHERLKALCPKARLAEWVRETCLQETSHQSKAPYPPVEPALLRQLAGIGNNLNQIARKLNSGEWRPRDRLQITALLAAIDRELITLKDQHQ